LADINLSAAQATAKDLESGFPGVEVLPLNIDVAKEASINKAVADAVRQFGRIDYAVNNAGIGGSGALSAEHKVEDWIRTIDVNLQGIWLSSRAEIREMLTQDKREE
jgi:NAD(P)-dependent dehydrogenase (short-subunit alcohol dehydrogenase family)